MSITFNETITNMRQIERYIAADDIYNYVGYYSTDFDLIPTDAAVGDAILFQLYNSYGGKGNTLLLEMSEVMEYTTLEGIWEYYSCTSGTYDNAIDTNWKPLQGVKDSSNGFTVVGDDGYARVSWDMPTDWDNYCNPKGQVAWYCFNIRFRITAVDGITNTGRVLNVRNLPYTISVVGQDVTFEDIYQANIDGGWGVVTRQGESDYTFNCGLQLDSSSSLIGKNCTVTFVDNYIIYNAGKALFGELNSQLAPENGITIRFEGANADHSQCYLGKYDSQFIDTVVRFPETARSHRMHGFWGGGIGSYDNQLIAGCNLYNFRNYTFTNSSVVVSGLSYYNAHTEPNGAIIDTVKCINSSYGIRPNVNSNSFLSHRMDMSAVTSANTNPWRVSAVEDWFIGIVDSIYNESLPIAKYYQYITDDNQYVNNYKVIDYKSYQVYLYDSSLNRINDATVQCFNNSGEIVINGTTNADGYVCENYGEVTNTDNKVIEYSGYIDASNDIKRYYEVLITSGESNGSKRIIASSAASSITLATQVDGFTAGDRFIEIPYIAYRWQRPAEDQVEGYDYSPIEYQGPFKLVFRKYGYVFVDVEETMESPVNNSVGTIVNNYTLLSEAEASVISGITVDTINNEIVLTNSNAINDIYCYIQYWCSQADNMQYPEIMSTTNGITYKIADGWTLVLDSTIIGSSDIQGEVKIKTTDDIIGLHVIGNISYDVTSDTVYMVDSVVDGTVSNNTTNELFVGLKGTSLASASGDYITVSKVVNFKLNGLAAGTEVRVYDTNNVELFGIETVDDVYVNDYNYSTDINATIVIYNVKYKPVRLPVILSDKDISIDVQQQPDRWYIND